MKHTSSKKTAQHKLHQATQRASAGPDGISLAPPAYGIESINQSKTLAHIPQVVTQRKVGFEFETQNSTLPDIATPVNNHPQNLQAWPEVVGNTPLEIVTEPIAEPLSETVNHIPEEEVPKKATETSIQKKAAGPTLGNNTRNATENRTGLPDALKSGVESLSGLAMDDVRVHYNSHKPAGLQALAYAQGSDIHIAPGQERHLPHEAWHVVQQKQGRVKATFQMKGVQVNDDNGLEHEADVMGAKAFGNTLQRKVGPEKEMPLQGKFEPMQRMASPGSISPGVGVVQMERYVNNKNSRIHLHLDIGTEDHLQIFAQRYNLMGRSGYDPDRVAVAKRALRRAAYVPDKVACWRELQRLI